MPARQESRLRYELVDAGPGWYVVVAIAPPIEPPMPGEEPDDPAVILAARQPKKIGVIGGRWDGTYGVAYTDVAGPEVPLGRTVSPDEGRLLLEHYRRAKLVIDLAETWGRNDALHLEIRPYPGGGS